ncbi:hypothetical protein ACPDHL_01290 [Myroides sp. C15-4]|uniref:hypothetical protein n=1 Tax=Myroides sp. C15-4 TaxID=3400532 RepID=UPI003D2F5286
MKRFLTSFSQAIPFLFLVVGMILLLQNIDRLLYKETLNLLSLFVAFGCITISILGQRKRKKKIVYS